jgi:hypothetical protein
MERKAMEHRGRPLEMQRSHFAHRPGESEGHVEATYLSEVDDLDRRVVCNVLLA